ncbi:MAG TPA: CHAD domain-containing protein [Candidatus Sulfopaludibacter sp.]|nr:CHAD domain-containing protein [Candidatus Sulfopaludibacter sp.]
MKWKSSENAAGNARRVLPRLAQDYFEAGRKVVEEKRSAKALHRFRLATKRFRYALELFQPLYGPSLGRRLKAVHAIQDVLGKISDQQTILDLLEGDKEIEAKVKRALKRSSREFRKQWHAFDSDGQLKQWKSYLARGRRPGTAARKRP